MYHLNLRPFSRNKLGGLGALQGLGPVGALVAKVTKGLWELGGLGG